MFSLRINVELLQHHFNISTARHCLLAIRILGLIHVSFIVVGHQHTQCTVTCSVFTFGLITCCGSLLIYFLLFWKLRVRLHVIHKLKLCHCMSVCSSRTSAFDMVVWGVIPTRHLRHQWSRSHFCHLFVWCWLTMSRKYAKGRESGWGGPGGGIKVVQSRSWEGGAPLQDFF